MTICKNCGNSNMGGKFCTACGTSLETEQRLICPACKREYSNGRFCVACGCQLISAQQSQAPEQSLVCVQCSRTFTSGTFCIFCGGMLKKPAPVHNGNNVLLKMNYSAEDDSEQFYDDQNIFNQEYGENSGSQWDKHENEPFISQNVDKSGLYVDLGYETDNDPEKTISPDTDYIHEPETEVVQKDRYDVALQDFLKQYRAEKYGIEPEAEIPVESVSQQAVESQDDFYAEKETENEGYEDVAVYEDIYTDGSVIDENYDRMVGTGTVFEDISSELLKADSLPEYTDEEQLPNSFEDVMSFASEIRQDESENIKDYIENAVAASLENVQQTYSQEAEMAESTGYISEPVLIHEEPQQSYSQESETEENLDFVAEPEPIYVQPQQVHEPVYQPMQQYDQSSVSQEAEMAESTGYISEPVLIHEEPQQSYSQESETEENLDFVAEPEPIYVQPQQVHEPVYQPVQQYDQSSVPTALPGFVPPVQQVSVPSGTNVEIDPMFGPVPDMAFTMYSQNGVVSHNNSRPVSQMSKQELKAQRKAEKLRMKEEKRRLKQEMKNLK